MPDRRRSTVGRVAAAEGFVEAMAASPLGVTLLAVLESRTRRPEGYALSLETSPASVAAAVEMPEMMSFGAFADLGVLTGSIYVGPWISDAPSTVAAAYHHAAARLAIAEAVAERFANELHAPLGRAAQQWWTDGAAGIASLAPLFDRFDAVPPRRQPRRHPSPPRTPTRPTNAGSWTRPTRRSGPSG